MILSRIAKNLRSRDWGDALIEVGIVVLGILIAVQVEEYRQSQNDRASEKELLLEIVSDLEATKEDLSIDIENGRERLALANQFLLELLSDTSDPVETTTSQSLDGLTSMMRLFPKLGGYQSLQNEGLHLISDPLIRQGITNFYELRLNRIAYWEKSVSNISFDSILLPHITVELRSSDMPETSDEIEELVVTGDYAGISDLRVLTKDPSFIPTLRRRAGGLRGIILKYEETSAEIDALVADIELHLTKL